MNNEHQATTINDNQQNTKNNKRVHFHFAIRGSILDTRHVIPRGFSFLLTARSLLLLHLHLLVATYLLPFHWTFTFCCSTICTPTLPSPSRLVTSFQSACIVCSTRTSTSKLIPPAFCTLHWLIKVEGPAPVLAVMSQNLPSHRPPHYHHSSSTS